MTRNDVLQFTVGAKSFALPGADVERVIANPRIVRMPEAGGVDAIHLGDDLLPMVHLPGGSSSQESLALVVATPDGRLAVEIDDVVGLRPATNPAGEGSAPPLPASFLSLPRPTTHQTAAFPAWRGRTRSTDMAPQPRRMLRVTCGDAGWLIPASELVSVHGATALEPIPGIAPETLAAVLVRDRIHPIVRLPGGGPLPANASGVVIVRASQGLLALAVDRIDGWTVEQATTAVLRSDELWTASDLRPYSETGTNPGTQSSGKLSILPIMLGTQRYALPMSAVVRFAGSGVIGRLPDGPGRDPKLHGTAAIEGRVVPFTDIRPDPVRGSRNHREAFLVLVRVHNNLHALAADAVERPVRIEASQLHRVTDPAGRLAAIVRLETGTIPILDLERLLPDGMP